MLEAIVESRDTVGGLNSITLSIPEKEYELTYDSYSDTNAKEILKRYLQYHQDDGVPSDVYIQHDKNRHIVNIHALLHYLDNEHTDPRVYPSDVL